MGIVNLELGNVETIFGTLETRPDWPDSEDERKVLQIPIICILSSSCSLLQWFSKLTYLPRDKSIDEKGGKIDVAHYCPPKISLERLLSRNKAARSTPFYLYFFIFLACYLTSLSAILSGKGRAVNVFHHLETTWNIYPVMPNLKCLAWNGKPVMLNLKYLT